MTTKEIKNNLLRFLVVIFLIAGCIEDNISPPLTGELDSVAEMIVYFESQGDFPNSNAAPALIDAEEVYSNLSNYLIVDVRDNGDYIAGHIEGAVNVQNDSLYSHIKSISPNLYPKIVLVSTNGHRSAYFTCLLRMAGFDNIYSMNFGMAAWNLYFSSEWLNSIDNIETRNRFNNVYYPKMDLRNLPEIMFENADAPIKERVDKRIETTIKTGFNKINQYRSGINLYGDDLLVCYGKSRLYNSPISALVDPGRGHAVGTIHYADAPFYEFRTVQFLQTLPTDRTILIYSYNGQLSACMVAYLRVLGYDAISLEFGANQMFYNRILNDVELMEFAFTSFVIKDYPFEIEQ